MYQNSIGLTRRQFMAATSTILFGTVLAVSVPERKDEIAMKISFHTDTFNSSYWNFEKSLAWLSGTLRELNIKSG